MGTVCDRSGAGGAYIYPFVTCAVDAPDFGVFLNGADLLNHGEVPSRDFLEPQGPGSFVWLALFFRLFGTTLETARAVLIATGVAISLLSFHISRRLRRVCGRPIASWVIQHKGLLLAAALIASILAVKSDQAGIGFHGNICVCDAVAVGCVCRATRIAGCCVC